MSFIWITSVSLTYLFPLAVPSTIALNTIPRKFGEHYILIIHIPRLIIISARRIMLNSRLPWQRLLIEGMTAASEFISEDMWANFLVIGGAALVQYGSTRFTHDVNIAITPQTLHAFKEKACSDPQFSLHADGHWAYCTITTLCSVIRHSQKNCSPKMFFFWFFWFLLIFFCPNFVTWLNIRS